MQNTLPTAFLGCYKFFGIHYWRSSLLTLPLLTLTLFTCSFGRLISTCKIFIGYMQIIQIIQ